MVPAAHFSQQARTRRRLFGLDALQERERARRGRATHLARARWMAENGYWELLKSIRH